jgi:hypothetical protein
LRTAERVLEICQSQNDLPGSRQIFQLKSPAVDQPARSSPECAGEWIAAVKIFETYRMGGITGR